MWAPQDLVITYGAMLSDVLRDLLRQVTFIKVFCYFAVILFHEKCAIVDVMKALCTRCFN